LEGRGTDCRQALALQTLADACSAVSRAWGRQASAKWLQLLNDHWIGPKNRYLCGDEITIADYFGACLVSIGELIGCELTDYPNVARWLANMKKLKHWDEINEVFSGVAASTRGKEFARVP
jgi:glutathione S-transferase